LKDIDAIAAVFYPCDFLPLLGVSSCCGSAVSPDRPYRRLWSRRVEAWRELLVFVRAMTFRQTPCVEQSSSCIGERGKGFTAALGACEDPAGDVPSDRMLLSPDRENLASAFKGDFHIGQRPGIEAICNQGRLLNLWHRTASTGQANLNGGNSRQTIIDHVAGACLACLSQLAAAQRFAGLPRLAKNIPCKSAAFRRMPAFFMASVRSGPGGIMRACSSAAKASASKSTLGRWSFFSSAMNAKVT
jgi:hypothetical protein